MIQLPAPDFVTLATVPANEYVNRIQSIFYLDDHSGVVFVQYPHAINRSGFMALVVDESGATTLYSTGYYPGSNLYRITNIIPLGSGVFLVSMLGDRVVTFVTAFANAKLNNSVPIPLLPFAVPQNPCYNGNAKFFYDAISKIFCVGYYNASGQEGGQVYASFFTVSKRGLLLLRTGFVGNYGPGYDPLAQNAFSNAAFTIIPNTLVNQSNGVQTQLAYNASGQYGSLLSANKINPGLQTNCATPSGATVSLRTAQMIYAQQNAYDEYTNFFDTNLPGIVTGGPYDDNAIQGAACQFYDIAGNAYTFAIGGNASPYNVLLTQNAAWYYDGTHVYRGTMAVPSAPKWGLSVLSPLINMHRPVSIFGAYKS